jgi:hypothetical protein
MTGWRLMSSMPTMMRSLSSCFDATRCGAGYRAGELGEESLDEVEPRAVLGREGELEPAGWLGGQPSSGFFRDVRGMIVEDQLDRGAGRIGGIDKLEELDELSAAVAVPDQGMDLAGEQINPGQQAESLTQKCTNARVA